MASFTSQIETPPHPVLGEAYHIFCGGYRYQRQSDASDHSNADLTEELMALAESAQSTKIELEKLGIMTVGWADWNTHGLISHTLLLDDEGKELFPIVGPSFQVNGHYESTFQALGTVSIPCRRSGAVQLSLTAAGDLERKPLPDGEMVNIDFVGIEGKGEVCALGMDQINLLKVFEKPYQDSAWIKENSQFLEEKTCACICVCTCEEKKSAAEAVARGEAEAIVAAASACPFSGREMVANNEGGGMVEASSKCPFKALFGGGSIMTTE